MSRPRHQDDRIEQILRDAERHGWTFTFRSGKFKGRCSCGGHMHVITQHGSSSTYTSKNMLAQLRAACWSE